MNLESLINTSDFKKTSDPNQIRINCPFCGNTKYKLYVHKTKKVFLCFRCNKTGRLSGENTVKLDAFQIKVEEFKNGKSIREINKEIKLPEEFMAIERLTGAAYNYLRRRGISNNEINRYKIGYCTDGDFRERIILPIFSNGRLIYYIGRTYTSLTPKYRNARVGRKEVIFKTFSEPVKFCILVEGVFDAISVGRIFPAISLLGKVCSDSQAKQIAKYTNKVYVMLDKDAKKNTFDVACLLSHYIEAIPIFINHKDPGEMNSNQIKEAIKNENI